MAKRKVNVELIDEFMSDINPFLPTGWVGKYIDKYGANLRGRAVLNMSNRLDNIRAGGATPTKEELKNFKKIMLKL